MPIPSPPGLLSGTHHSVHAGDFSQDGKSGVFVCRTGASSLHRLSSLGIVIVDVTGLLPGASLGCLAAQWLDTDLDGDLVWNLGWGWGWGQRWGQRWRVGWMEVRERCIPPQVPLPLHVVIVTIPQPGPGGSHCFTCKHAAAVVA